MGIGAGDHDFAGLNRLAQGFQHGAGKFGKLIHEEHAVMRKADFPRLGAAPTAHDSGHRGGMVRLAKGAGAVDAALGQEPREGVDHRGFQRLGGG